jgi:hypothetical protein
MPLGSLTPAATVEEVMKASSIGLPSALDARYELWRPWPARQLASCKTLAIQVLDVAQRDYERSRP